MYSHPNAIPTNRNSANLISFDPREGDMLNSQLSSVTFNDKARITFMKQYNFPTFPKFPFLKSSLTGYSFLSGDFSFSQTLEAPQVPVQDPSLISIPCLGDLIHHQGLTYYLF